jgi:ABC-type Mn2+/Zn2+ transport system permease subunit
MALTLAGGPIGTLLLPRRISLEGDVLSHAVMPGLAAHGFFARQYTANILNYY